MATSGSDRSRPDDLFGRADMVSLWRIPLEATPQVPIVLVGPSGIGKSAVLRAAARADGDGGLTALYRVRTAAESPENLAHELARQLLSQLPQTGLSAKELGRGLAGAVRDGKRALAVAALLDGAKALMPALSDFAKAAISELDNSIQDIVPGAHLAVLQDTSAADFIGTLVAILDALAMQGIRGRLLFDQVENGSETLSEGILALAREAPSGWLIGIAINDETPQGVRWIQRFWPDYAYLQTARYELTPLSRQAVEEWYLSVRGTLPDSEELAIVLRWSEGRPLVLDDWIHGRVSGEELKHVWDRLGPYYARRIQDLSLRSRTLIRRMALFPAGMVFSFDLIHALAGGLSAEENLDLLAELESALFVSATQDVVGEVSYRFRHDIIHLHALYGVPPSVRSELGAAVSAAVTAVPVVDPTLDKWIGARLALAAGDRVRGPAVVLLGARALFEARSFVEAEALLRRAITEIPDLANSEHDKLIETLAEVLVGLGRYREALVHLSKLDSASAAGLLLTGRAFLRLNQYSAAGSALEQARAQFDLMHDSAGSMASRRELVTIMRDLGEYSEADSASQLLLAEVAVLNDDPSGTGALARAAVLRTAARSMALVGKVEEAQRLAGEALVLARGRSMSGEATAHLALAEAYRHGGVLDRAIEHYEEASAISSQIGNRDCYLWSRLGVGDCLLLSGEPAACLAAIGEALAWVKGLPDDHPLEYLHLSFLAEIAAVQAGGEYSEQRLQRICKRYSALGIEWPIDYVRDFVAGAASTAMKF